MADTPVCGIQIHRGVRRDELPLRVRACVMGPPPAFLLRSLLRSVLSELGGDAAGESGAEVGDGVALDLTVGFFSGAELGDGAHFA